MIIYLNNKQVLSQLAKLYLKKLLGIKNIKNNF